MTVRASSPLLSCLRRRSLRSWLCARCNSTAQLKANAPAAVKAGELPARTVKEEAGGISVITEYSTNPEGKTVKVSWRAASIECDGGASEKCGRRRREGGSVQRRWRGGAVLGRADIRAAGATNRARKHARVCQPLRTSRRAVADTACRKARAGLRDGGRLYAFRVLSGRQRGTRRREAAGRENVRSK
jgi:hypothetical protein